MFRKPDTLSADQYKLYCNLDDPKHFEFYRNYYEEHTNIPPLYDEITEEKDKKAFKIMLKDHGYCEWLRLSDEKLMGENGERICQIISEWQRNQSFLGFLSDVENKIVDAYRDPQDRTKVTLDNEIRKKNREVIQDMDAQNDEQTKMIQQWDGTSMQFSQGKKT